MHKTKPKRTESRYARKSEMEEKVWRRREKFNRTSDGVGSAVKL